MVFCARVKNKVVLMIVEKLMRGRGHMFGLFKKSCAICKRKVKPLRKYRNDRNDVMHVCVPCSEYAERRAYRKVT